MNRRSLFKGLLAGAMLAVAPVLRVPKEKVVPWRYWIDLGTTWTSQEIVLNHPPRYYFIKA